MGTAAGWAGERSVKLCRSLAWGRTTNRDRVVSRIRGWAGGGGGVASGTTAHCTGALGLPNPALRNPSGLQLILAADQLVKCRVCSASGQEVKDISLVILTDFISFTPSTSVLTPTHRCWVVQGSCFPRLSWKPRCLVGWTRPFSSATQDGIWAKQELLIPSDS